MYCHHWGHHMYGCEDCRIRGWITIFRVIAYLFPPITVAIICYLVKAAMIYRQSGSATEALNYWYDRTIRLKIWISLFWVLFIFGALISMFF